MIFNKQGATIRKFKFYFQGEEIEIVKQYTYLGFTFIRSGKKHQWIENLINKGKKSWFILQRFLCKSEGKTVNTYLNLIDATIKPVALYACEIWEDHKDQNNLNEIEKFHLSLCKQIVGVKNNISSSKLLGELGRFPFRISIETQLFKYLQRIPFVKGDCYLRKAFNEELANKESAWVTKMRHLLECYGMSSLILNIFKVLNDEIDKKEYKNKHKFF